MTTPFQRQLLQDLMQEDHHVSGNPLPHAYASEAYACGRKIGLRMFRKGSDSDPDIRFKMAGKIGTFVHEMFQKSMHKVFRNFKEEFRWDIGYLSGRADGLYEEDSHGLTVIEIKSMGMNAFGRSLKNGPSKEHIMQAAFTAEHEGTERVHMIYMNRALDMKRPGILEWELAVDMDEVEMERERLRGITMEVREGIVPEPFYNGDVIMDPYEVKSWPCGWCEHRVVCAEMGPRPMPLAVAQDRGLIELQDMTV
jgi:hypothetical protein